MNRIPTLDGWRGIAIAIVLLDHATALSHSPFHLFYKTASRGVALFFVLSGFLITSRQIAERESTGSISLKSFYLRRAFRLWPCAYFFLLVLAVVFGLSFPEIARCVFFYRNVGMTDVGMKVGSILTAHFWSLSIEEQFYLTWPFLLILTGRRAPWLLGLLVVLGLPYYTSFYVWPFVCLLLGCLFAFVPYTALDRVAKNSHGLLVVACLIALAAGAFLFKRVTPHWFEFPAIAFLIWSTATGRFRTASAILGFKPLTWLGVVSYSIYVWQPICLAVLGSSWTAVLTKIIVTLLMGVVSYYCVEEPMIRWGKRIVLSSGAKSSTAKRLISAAP